MFEKNIKFEKSTKLNIFEEYVETFVFAKRKIRENVCTCAYVYVFVYIFRIKNKISCLASTREKKEGKCEGYKDLYANKNDKLIK